MFIFRILVILKVFLINLSFVVWSIPFDCLSDFVCASLCNSTNLTLLWCKSFIKDTMTDMEKHVEALKSKKFKIQCRLIMSVIDLDCVTYFNFVFSLHIFTCPFSPPSSVTFYLFPSFMGQHHHRLCGSIVNCCHCSLYLSLLWSGFCLHGLDLSPLTIIFWGSSLVQCGLVPFFVVCDFCSLC